MRKAAETPCKQKAFRDPPRTPAGPLPDPFPSNTPATRAPPATTNLPERLEPPPSKRLGPFPDCTVGPGLPSPPVNAVGASAGRRAAAPARAEALPSRLGGRRSDESERKGFGKEGFDHSLLHCPLRGNGPSYGRIPIPALPSSLWLTHPKVARLGPTACTAGRGDPTVGTVADSRPSGA